MSRGVRPLELYWADIEVGLRPGMSAEMEGKVAEEKVKDENGG